MSLLYTALALFRLVLLVAGVVAAVVFALDWVVRTRRIGPFSAIARFMRRVVDPLLLPIERRIVRAGGTPASAPWWGLVAVVVGGIVLISVTDYAVGLALGMASAASRGGAALPAMLLSLAIGVLQIALLVRVFSSWLPISPMSPWIRWSYALTEWFLAPLRQIVPTIGAFDITPIVAYYLIRFLGGWLVGIIAGLGQGSA